MHTYDTMSEAVKGLKDRGFKIDFNLNFDHISCTETPVSLMPSEFEITEAYRFEGNSDPADESVVYAISSKHGHQGVLVNGFGISADPVSDEMVQKLTLRHQEIRK
jgi:hypothetical protein